MDKNKIGLVNIKFGWCWLFAGILMAMWLGIFAFKADWLGDYASLQRRFLRLAHISFMALSLTSVLYGICIDSSRLSVLMKTIGSYSMIIAAIFMPTICLLSMYNSFFQLFFFIPALAFACSIFIMALGQIRRVV